MAKYQVFKRDFLYVYYYKAPPQKDESDDEDDDDENDDSNDEDNPALKSIPDPEAPATTAAHKTGVVKVEIQKKAKKFNPENLKKTTNTTSTKRSAWDD